MNILKVGEKIRLNKINPEGITYRDWLNERDPLAQDVARVIHVFDNDVITYDLSCESELGYIWGALIAASFIEYEVLR